MARKFNVQTREPMVLGMEKFNVALEMSPYWKKEDFLRLKGTSSVNGGDGRTLKR